MKILIYITTEFKDLREYSSKRLLRRILNLAYEFKDDDLNIICRPNDVDRLTPVAHKVDATLSHFGQVNYMANNTKGCFLLQDTSPCITKNILLHWQKKLTNLHSRKIVSIRYPFQVSIVKADFTLFSPDLVNYLINSGRPIESWLDFKPGTDLVTCDSLDYLPMHLPDVYKRYREDTEFPEVFMVEPTTHCSLKCTMCPYHSDVYKQAAKLPYISEKDFIHMDFGLWKDIIDEAAAHDVVNLVPQYRGEPFMHPRFLEMLLYARKMGMTNMAFPTNGILLDDKVIEKLLDIDLSSLLFSFDGLTKATYEGIRQNSNFEKVMRNILKFRDRRNARGLKRPILQVTFVESESNREEREGYIRFWTKEVERVRINICLNYDELHSNQPFGFSLDGYPVRPPCPLTVSSAAITAEGKLLLCHTDSCETTILGTLRNGRTISEVYNSTNAQSIRDAHLTGNYKFINICTNCPLWRADWFKKFSNPEFEIYGGTWWMNYERKVLNRESDTLPFFRGLTSKLKSKIGRLIRG